jgi:hypothetical protein
VAASEQLSPNPKHFDELLADRAIAWFREQHPLAPQKPFFAYLRYRHGARAAPCDPGVDRQIQGTV